MILNKFCNICLFEIFDEYVIDIKMKKVIIFQEEDSFFKIGFYILCEELGILILKKKDLFEDFEIRCMF